MRQYNIRIDKIDDEDFPVLIDGIKQVIKNKDLLPDIIGVSMIEDNMVVSKSWKEDVCGNCLHLNNRLG